MYDTFILIVALLTSAKTENASLRVVCQQNAEQDVEIEIEKM